MMPLPRLEKLRMIMRAGGLDLVALIPGATLRWLGGGEHYLGERPIVVFIPQAEPPLAVLPQLEEPLFRASPLARGSLRGATPTAGSRPFARPWDSWRRLAR